MTPAISILIIGTRSCAAALVSIIAVIPVIPVIARTSIAPVPSVPAIVSVIAIVAIVAIPRTRLLLRTRRLAAAAAFDSCRAGRSHWSRRRSRSRRGRLGRRIPVGARCRFRDAFIPRIPAAAAAAGALGVLTVRIVAGISTGTAGGTWTTSAPRWASTFSHAFVG